MKIIYQGQIGVVAGLTSEVRVINRDATVAELIQEIAKELPAEVARFLVDSEGNISTSLFAAVDGDHVQDYSVRLGDAHELLLMPPMAGG